MRRRLAAGTMAVVPVSTLGYALLGFLAYERLTGYDLARLLREPLGFFWTARHSQIYPELQKLRRQDLVRSELVRQATRPDKKIYSITPKGRARLAEWTTEPLGPAVMRDEELLKTYSIWLGKRDAALTFYRAAYERHRALLARHRRLEAALQKELGKAIVDPASPEFGNYATLRRGIGYEREKLAWYRWMIEQLERPVRRSRSRSRVRARSVGSMRAKKASRPQP